MTLHRRHALALLAGGLATPALAHHGWRWTDSGKFEVTGVVETADLGNPHGVLTLAVEDEIWTVQVGQPWRNARAGLTDDMLAPGTEVTILGARSANPEELLVKAEAVSIGGTQYVLYPNRM